MRVYVVADLEGVSGVGGYDVHDRRSPLAAARRQAWLSLWAAEVNAAVAAAFGAGADDVLVVDNHSAGDTLPLAGLPAGGRLIHGGGRPTWLPGLDDTVDAVVVVGQHGMAGGTGHLRHTYSRRRLERVTLNGAEIGEAGLIVGIAGERGVPVVALSGDEAAVAEYLDLVPSGEGVAVKQALSRHACISLPARASRRRIAAAVRRGLRRRDQIEPRPFAPPLRLHGRYRRREGWRPAARWLRGGLRDGWWGRELRLCGEALGPLWDRFIGVGA